MRSYTETGMRATPRQLQRQHIFVVNGSADFLDIVRELLQGELYNVTTTNFVPDTFAQIEAAAPSLLIIDLVVGEQIGWSLLAKLHEEATIHQLPIILVSTTPRLLDEARARHGEIGGDRYLSKPFDLGDLIAMIDDLVGQA
jgi:DNA-binding response OmpR family regulator